MVVALKKLLKLRNRRALGFACVSFFATIILARMHPTLAQATEKTVRSSNAVNIASVTNIFEIGAGLLLAFSLITAIPRMLFISQHDNKWEALKAPLLCSVVGLFSVLVGSSLIFEHWTPVLVGIAWGNIIVFLMVLQFVLTHNSADKE